MLGALLVLAAALGAAELVLRARAAHGRPLLVESAPGRWTLAPRWKEFAPVDVVVPPGRTRIVYMGASTEKGFPFGPRSSPAAWVERILRWRGADVEVVAVAAGGLVASETLDLFPEVLALQPAAVVVGTGHNEYMRTNWLLASPFWGRLQLVQRLVALLGRTSMVHEAPTLEDDFDDQVIADSLRDTLRELQRRADEAGVPLLVTVPVCNLAGFPPILGDDPRLPESPDQAFDRGRALLAAGDLAGARAALVAARDTDRWPHRATTPFIEAILAEVRHVVRTDLAFERACPTGIPGDELFVDHCHPTAAGSRVLALAVCDALELDGIIPLTGHGGDAPPLAELVAAAGITPQDELRARADTARAFVLFALHTGHHGRLADMAAERLAALSRTAFAPGEAGILHALLALLRDDVDEARERLDAVRRDAPDKLGELAASYAGFRWIREAFERNGLSLEAASASADP